MTDNKIRKEIKDGITMALPIVIGYFPIAMAFGLLSKNSLISLRDTSMLSSVVYAGASQFMAIDLISAGVSYGSIVLATFLLNLRHMMMTAALSMDFQDIPRKYLPFIAYGITDESFSVISFNKDKIGVWFVLVLNTLAYLSWNIGTIIGYFVGEILPNNLQSSLSVGLYAMFASLLFPEFKKERSIIVVSLISVIVYLGIHYSGLFSLGWDIIFGVVISSIIGVLVKNKLARGERR